MLFTDVSADRAIRAFSKVGFRIVTRGKHIGMSDGAHRIIIPDHKRLNPYTLRTIIKDAGLTDEEFKELLSTDQFAKQYLFLILGDHSPKILRCHPIDSL